MWGSSPEIPKTGSPLAKGELQLPLAISVKCMALVGYLLATLCFQFPGPFIFYLQAHNRINPPPPPPPVCV
jgi:hypothetical protein